MKQLSFFFTPNALTWSNIWFFIWLVSLVDTVISYLYMLIFAITIVIVIAVAIAVAIAIESGAGKN